MAKVTIDLHMEHEVDPETDESGPLTCTATYCDANTGEQKVCEFDSKDDIKALYITLLLCQPRWVDS